MHVHQYTRGKECNRYGNGHPRFAKLKAGLVENLRLLIAKRRDGKARDAMIGGLVILTHYLNR